MSKYFDGEVLSAYEDLNKEFECKEENVKLHKQILYLQSQLAEKEKEIVDLKLERDNAVGCANMFKVALGVNQNQKAIEQLGQIINIFEPYENENKDTILCANNGISFLEYIDNQIEELKKEMK